MADKQIGKQTDMTDKQIGKQTDMTDTQTDTQSDLLSRTVPNIPADSIDLLFAIEQILLV